MGKIIITQQLFKSIKKTEFNNIPFILEKLENWYQDTSFKLRSEWKNGEFAILEIEDDEIVNQENKPIEFGGHIHIDDREKMLKLTIKEITHYSFYESGNSDEWRGSANGGSTGFGSIKEQKNFTLYELIDYLNLQQQ